ncbi:asparagine synthase-related protein [Citreimonas sp.]|uniref:asparagine synthase-related protein n=1 Tax=Citreimonas sp. TaxID=3036715 RepID=UPI0040583C84
MSGICGIVSFGAAPPPDAATVRGMTAALERRGPDGTTHWIGDGVALAHTRLVTTPEARAETQPLVHAPSGCVITADLRLDNRRDLSERLSIDLGARTVGDAELVLAAWLRWGEACPEHLLGDFAFALWDPRKRLLFAARDQMGMKQFIYGCTGPSRLIFASSPSAVRLVAPEAFPLNEARVADYLEDMEAIDRTSTFFRGILRLPPAHRLVFDEKGLRVSRYWQLKMPPERIGSARDHEDAFLDAFTEAVRARLRGAGPVGSMMSGGMDSSAVVATASRLLADTGAGPLRTYSVVSPDPEGCKETQAVDAMMDVPGIHATRIRRDGPPDSLQHRLDALARSEEPFDSTMSLLRAIYRAARDDGVRVVLDGAAGDIVFSEGDVHARLLARGRWRDVLRDAAGARQFWNGHGPRPARALAAAAWRLALPERVRLMRRGILSTLSPVDYSGPPMVSDDLARRVHLQARRRAFFAPGQDGPRVPERVAAVLIPGLTVGRERYDRVAAEYGIEPRDPFMDLRVIRACLQTPPEFMQAQGWPKYLLRQAMREKLPDAVRWRRDKSHLGWQLTDAVLARHPGLGVQEIDDLRAFGVHERALAADARRLPPWDENWKRLVYLAAWNGN